MEILLRAKCFQRLAIPGSVRPLHNDYRLVTPQNFSNYDSIKQDFKLEIPEYFNFAQDVLDQWTNVEKAGKRPSNPAFWWISGKGKEVRWSFEELGSLSRKFANILTEACALQRGDRVILILPRIPEWWLANVACLRTEPQRRVGEPQGDDETKHDEMMAIYFTSGTSGPPKMTGHTHSSFGLGLSVNGRFWLDLTSSDVMWNTSDTGWAKSAWSSVFSPWIQGACVFAHYLPHFEPTSILQTLSKFPITVFCSAPTAYRMLVQSDMSRSCKFKNLKHCVSAGEPINPEVIEQWRNRTGLDIYEGYGQTETDNPTKTASTLRGNFYITGDRGYMDEDGYRIGPFEVENALIEHPAIAESAVVSSPDPVRGEVVKAFIVLNPDYKSRDQEELKKEIQEHVKKTTAPYKYPRKVEFIQELPKTSSGKIKRNELRKKEWETI
ncbi:hypothetical protein HPG69_005098 [Diceros bicornis minor]|uniref:medium-chain acyl-CoA ligase n=1 Tax=Diceros bicornis minor TaxID=77932 RepID=A0A7J7EEU7_DICBM|nr:hypothetical protein HPG69_005098 [Diceros bicornis minor]